MFSRKGPYPLLWAGSQAARVKITMSVVPTGLKYCVIPKHIYTHKYTIYKCGRWPRNTFLGYTLSIKRFMN